jgi:hypothetical protein
MMAEDDAPLREAILTIIDAARAYLTPDGIAKRRLSPACCRRPTIPGLSPPSPLVVTPCARAATATFWSGLRRTQPML